jgi:sialic acid synthase SpsE
MSYFSNIERTLIIAEIGVNHNGDMVLAKRMIEEAKRCGADAVKFQTYKSEKLARVSTPKVNYQQETTSSDESHFQMLQSLELSPRDHRILKDFSDSLDIDFLSTPYDKASAKFLFELGVKMFKTASADIVDLPLHRYIASTGLPVIIATGMASLGEIESLLTIYEDAKHEDVVLLHCVSNYPCSDESINLRAMKVLENAFNVSVGYSDHSQGSVAAIIAAGMGAKVIEKHFTLDQSMDGPDHKASSTPNEFFDLVKGVRRAEIILGEKRKTMQSEELQMSQVSRKSAVFNRDMKKGDRLDWEDLDMMRPSGGLNGKDLICIEGMPLRSDVCKGHQLKMSDIDGK